MRDTVHKTLYIPRLDADIDKKVVPLVLALGRFPLLTTFSSCQGDPGPMTGGGTYGHVDFTYGPDWLTCCTFCFGRLAPEFRDIFDDVIISVWQTDSAPHIYGSIKIRSEAIPTAAMIVESLYTKLYLTSDQR